VAKCKNKDAACCQTPAGGASGYGTLGNSSTGKKVAKGPAKTSAGRNKRK
jgi:hypothetical protein